MRAAPLAHDANGVASAVNVDVWRPFDGFQTIALAAREFEVLLGGAKGPGKSELILVGATRQVNKARYKALITRPSYPELVELIDRSHRLFKRMPEKPHWDGENRRWKFPSGAIIAFGYLGVMRDVERYHGQEWAYWGPDEIGKLADPAVYTRMIAEVRCPDPTVIRMVRASANPGQQGHAWLKKRFIVPCGEDGSRVYWEKFEVPFTRQRQWLSRRFVPGRVTDNPIYLNDPTYMAQLMSLPHHLRKHLLEGSWDDPNAMALPELNARVHIVPAFRPPRHWKRYGAHDWGYAHPWTYCEAVISEDGRIFVVDGMKGRRMKDSAIAMAIMEKFPHKLSAPAYAGHDLWHSIKSRREDEEETVSTQERYASMGLHMQKASIGRQNGLRQFVEMTAWRGTGPNGDDGVPYFQWMDTRANWEAFEQCEAMIRDPDNPEDALKVDADPQTGLGGDDWYDLNRYLVASVPGRRSRSLGKDRTIHVDDTDVLVAENERGRRPTHKDRRRVVKKGTKGPISFDGIG